MGLYTLDKQQGDTQWGTQWYTALNYLKDFDSATSTFTNKTYSGGTISGTFTGNLDVSGTGKIGTYLGVGITPNSAIATYVDQNGKADGLRVVNVGAGSVAASVACDANNAYFGTSSAHDLKLMTAGSPKMTILNSTSNVLIGTTTDTNSKCTIEGALALKDGITAPATSAGYAQIYVDTSDGDLKVKFGDGTVKTITTDS